MWHLFQSWSLARAAGRLPVEVCWAGGVGCAPAACPLCSVPAPAGSSLVERLRHLLTTYSAAGALRAAYRHAGTVQWALIDTVELDALAARVPVVGLAPRDGDERTSKKLMHFWRKRETATPGGVTH